MLSEQASKLGIDLQEYGFKNSCTGPKCLNKNNLKSIDGILNGENGFKQKAI